MLKRNFSVLPGLFLILCGVAILVIVSMIAFIQVPVPENVQIAPLDIAVTCETFLKLNEQTRCNEIITQCKQPDGKITFESARC